MAKLTENQIVLDGVSGKKYSFNIYPVNEECKDEGGVYVFSKRTANGADFNHTLIYCGITNSFVVRLDDSHHQSKCIKENNANCLCLLKEENETRRHEIETDILNNKKNPFRCNIAKNY